MRRSLDPDSVTETMARLRQRIHERFPGSGLAGVADELLEVARTSATRASGIVKPLLSVRFAIGLLVVVLIAALATVVHALLLKAGSQPESVSELVQAIEAGTNEMVFVGIAIVFLASIEGRIKRARVLSALHELRSLAHIVDMHQLTKSPDRLFIDGPDTASSPERSLSAFELSRYLDYCAEMLSLLGKVAAMYGGYTQDATSLAAVDQLEDLTSNLSHKIWQKIMIIQQGDAALRGRGDVPREALVSLGVESESG